VQQHSQPKVRECFTSLMYVIVLLGLNCDVLHKAPLGLVSANDGAMFCLVVPQVQAAAVLAHHCRWTCSCC
jgi:hypothetical protein